MKSGLTTVVNHTAEVRLAITELSKTQVMVGVPQDKAGRKDGGPINNATLAYIHNNGAPEAGIPARPFMAPGIESVKSELAQDMKVAGQLALEGKPEAVERQMMRAGMRARDAIKAKIRSGISPPLTAAGIRARKRRHKGRDVSSTIPLIDTAEMLNSISFELKKP